MSDQSNRGVVIMSWLREHWYVVAGLVVYVGLLLVQRVRRARMNKALDERFSKMDVFGVFGEIKPVIVLKVECDCGMGASCESRDAIVASGWIAPNRRGPDNRWTCPSCGRGDADVAR